MPIGMNHETENINAHQDIVLQTGSIFGNAGSSAPSGYLLCDGSAVNRTTYARLFTAIGTNYGAGDGNTTFNIPDGRGGVLRGAGTSSGYTQNVTVTLGAKLDDAGQNHKHADSGHYHYLNDGGTATGDSLSNVDTAPANEETNGVRVSLGYANIGGPTVLDSGTPRVSTETRVKSIGVNFFIKF
jgi:microcystin-dependent protein